MKKYKFNGVNNLEQHFVNKNLKKVNSVVRKLVH